MCFFRFGRKLIAFESLALSNSIRMRQGEMGMGMCHLLCSHIFLDTKHNMFVPTCTIGTRTYKTPEA